jgi:hypothetical protein
MFTHPETGMDLARDRYRDMLAQAQRLARRPQPEPRTGRKAWQPVRRLRRDAWQPVRRLRRVLRTTPQT